MKQFLRHIFLLVALVVATANVWAQIPVYNNGTWYSFYKSESFNIHTIDSKEFSVFAPTDGKLTFDWEYDGWIFPSHTTKIFESSDNGGNYFEKGQVSGTKNGTGNVTLSTNINKIKFDRQVGNTNNVYYTNVKVPLAKHILLAEGTYGTTSTSISFEDVAIDGTSNAQEVKLRSFLTTGNITVKSNNNAFRIKTSTNTNGDVYAVGANACAASGGSGNAGGGNLGNIENYTVTIYFCPSEAEVYTGTITLTDGTSTATISVSGTGLKKNQSIVWSEKFAADEPSIPVGKEVFDAATATSGLPVIYSSSNTSIIDITNDGASFKALAAGTATITASQAGDDKWNRTSSTKTITVTEKKIQYIKWTDNLTRFKTGDAPFTMTATAHILVNVETEETQEVPERTALIKYTSANSNIVSVNGNVLTIVGAGETYVTATLEGDDTYERAEITMPVRVRNVTDGCERFVLDAPDEVKYSAPGGGSYTPTSWTAPAGKLTFEARIGNGTAVGDIEVQQLVNGSWKDIDNFMPPTSWTEYGPYDLDRNATQVRFYSNGSFNRFIKNVLVTQATYVEPFVGGVQLAQNQEFVLPETAVGVPSENTFELNWSTCDEEGVFLEVDDPTKFKVQPTFISAESVHYGKTPITVTCIDPSVANSTMEGNIIITYDGNRTYRQPISCKVEAKLETEIVYAGLDSYYEIPEGIAIPFYVKDKKNGNILTDAVIILETSNEDILSFDATKIYPHCGGYVTLKATYAGDDTHEPASVQKTIFVSECNQRIVWPQDFRTYVATEEGAIDEIIELNAYAATDNGVPTGTPIQYSLDAAADTLARLVDNEDGTYSLHLYKTGKGYITASAVAYDFDGEKYVAAQTTHEIRVRKMGDPCDTYALYFDQEEYLLGVSASPIVKEIHGLPDATMYYYAHVNSGSVNNKFCISFSIDNQASWSAWIEQPITETYDWNTPYTCSVPENATHVRFSTWSSLVTYFNCVAIRQKTYLTPSVNEVVIDDAIVNQEFTYTFTVDYSDVPLIQYAITNNNNLNLKLTPSPEIHNDCGEHGKYTFTLTGTSLFPQTNVNETITIFTTAKHHIEIPITITSTLAETYYFQTADGNWSDLANWSVNGNTPSNLPTASNPVVISKNVTVDNQAVAYGIEMQDGAHINIAPIGGLTVHAGGYATTSQEPNLEITINNDHAGYFRMSPLAKTDMPKATVYFTTRGQLNGGNQDAAWQYIGAPGSGVGMDLAHTTVLYLRSEEKGWVRQYTEWAQLTPFDGYALTQKTQPDFTFYPQLINDNKTIQLTYTNSDAGGMEGDNLWANSYMAPLDITKFTKEDFSGNVEQTFYLYNSGSWNQWNSDQSAITDATVTPGRYYAINRAKIDTNKDQTVIPPMQGVYMKANPGGGTVTLNYEKHVWNNTQTAKMNTPLRIAGRDGEVQKQTPDFMRVRLQVNSENSGADRMYIIQDSMATAGYDNGYDAPKQMADGLMNIYTNEPFGKMEISSTNTMDGMYIGFHAGEDDEYLMTFTSLVGDSMYLYDIEEDIILLMEENEVYRFDAIPYSENDLRFQVLLHADGIDGDASDDDQGGITTNIENIPTVHLWVNDKRVYVADAPQNSTLSVYSVSGMCMCAPYTIHSAPYTLDLSHLPTGVYVLRLNDQAYKFVCK